MLCVPRFHISLAALLCTGLLTNDGWAQEAIGVADPNVSWGLSSLSDWDTALPFLDIARNMRPFFAFSNDSWEVMSNAAMVEGGYLDEDGYPIRIPKGAAGIRSIWAWNETLGTEQRKGLYILTYEGRGTITLGGAAKVVRSAPGRIIFENSTGRAVWLDITALDPGNHIRDLSVLRADHVALAEAGAVFQPDWLALIEDARELRFMDWMTTNRPTPTSWEERPRPQDATWADSGAPVELMVRLANETGTDPWFTMPHKADADYIRQFATYVRDHLDPRLKVHVENSNETWNAAFEQFHWLRDQAIADWGADVSEDWEAIFSYHTKRATEVALIWEDVFGAEAPARLVNVLGTQGGNVWLAEVQLSAPGWEKQDPEGYVDPATVFEELAATTYFGVTFMTNPDLRAELETRIRETGDGAYSWIFELVSQEGPLEDSIPVILERLAEQKEMANRFGLRLTVYEGGQHMHHSFAVGDLSEEQADELGRFMGEFVRSPEMGALYSQIWDGWRAIGEGPFMQFSETSAPSRWGSWGILSHAGDRSPRADFMLKRQAEGGSWWGEGGGPQYLHGRTETGSESADRMIGTDEEDFLAGLGGDDSFVASPGQDGINGGEGNDTYTLPDAADRYSITPEGQGYRVTGPQESAYLVNVEQITFGDGTTRALD